MFTTLAKAVAKQSKQREEELLEDSAVALARKRNAAQISLPLSTIGEQLEIITGEEDERTVLELTCNAYVFDRDSKQWKGIGQSYLHLNDTTLTDRTTSRLIIRLQSTRRVVVNTRIWSDMPVAYVTENKAVRIGALTVASQGQADTEGAIRTYMLRFTAADSARFLFEALQERRLSAEKLDTFVKRPRLDESQTPIVEANNAAKTSSSSHSMSRLGLKIRFVNIYRTNISTIASPTTGLNKLSYCLCTPSTDRSYWRQILPSSV